VLRRSSKELGWRGVLVAGGLAAAVSIAAPELAFAQGFFDFLFGGPKQEAPPPPPPSVNPKPPSGIGRVTPAPLGQENVNENGTGTGTGHSVVFCVRLCDGQHFPMEQMANATPAETCKAICPNSATKVFVGAEVASAVSSDGTRYSALNTAFLYRKRLVASCTCNGKDPFGLTPLDVRNDPTLRPGDIVATKQGFMSFSGKNGSAGSFTPATPAALSVGAASKQRLAQPAAAEVPEVEDEPGTIVPAAQPQGAPPASSARGPGR